MTPYCVVLVTAPKGAAAKMISTQILKERLAACVNITPAIESSYWWKGKIESAREMLLIIKTRKTLLPRLIKFVTKIHPYSVPEVISLPILSGSKPYLQWLDEETK